jgi:hypothetical protein
MDRMANLMLNIVPNAEITKRSIPNMLVKYLVWRSSGTWAEMLN